MITRLQEATPAELGHVRLRDALVIRLQISAREAKRRIAEARDLGPRTSLTGEPMAPLLARTAAAQAKGEIGPEHIALIRKTLKKLPTFIDDKTRADCEATLAHAATGLDPDNLAEAATQLLALIDEDGPMPNDAERARRRYLNLQKQGPDGMTQISGNLDPQALAVHEALMAKLAAPGMCNPDDAEPRMSGTPTQEQIDADTRTPGQRRHDAWAAIAQLALASGTLGTHNGLPVTVIVSTTLQELESAAGVARTGGGSLLPMPDVISMAARGGGHHYLAVFDQHTKQELYLGRERRYATSGQRIMCIARDGGCTKPGCTSGAYDCQVHHLVDFGRGKNGHTDIDSLTLACPPDNRAVHDHGGWTTTRGKDGRTQWIPPPHLDTGQRRTNDYHHPERMLKDNDPDDEEPA